MLSLHLLNKLGFQFLQPGLDLCIFSAIMFLTSSWEMTFPVILVLWSLFSFLPMACVMPTLIPLIPLARSQWSSFSRTSTRKSLPRLGINVPPFLPSLVCHYYKIGQRELKFNTSFTILQVSLNKEISFV